MSRLFCKMFNIDCIEKHCRGWILEDKVLLLCMGRQVREIDAADGREERTDGKKKFQT